MVIEFLKTIRSEILEEKLEIEAEQNSIRIKFSENIKFIEKLKEEDEQNFDAFSPRKQNTDLRESIRLLEEEQNTLSETSENLKKKLTSLNSKLDEIDSVLKIAKNQEAARVKTVDSSFYEDDLLKLKILETQENERQRIARELHDSSVQNLTSMVHKTELCSKLVEMDPIRCKLELTSMSRNIREIIEEMRKMIYNLHPMSFDDIGFDVTVERELSKIQEKGINTSYTVEGDVFPVKPVIALTLLRVITEACNNAMKHAEASMISVKIIYESEMIKISIKDDGKGFDVSKQECDIKDDYSGFGLSTMRERICLLSGKVDIVSSMGNGTEILIEVPIDIEED